MNKFVKKALEEETFIILMCDQCPFLVPQCTEEEWDNASEGCKVPWGCALEAYEEAPADYRFPYLCKIVDRVFRGEYGVEDWCRLEEMPPITVNLKGVKKDPTIVIKYLE